MLDWWHKRHLGSMLQSAYLRFQSQGFNYGALFVGCDKLCWNIKKVNKQRSTKQKTIPRVIFGIQPDSGTIDIPCGTDFLRKINK